MRFNVLISDGGSSQKKSKIEEARDLIANSVLTHVPVIAYNFKVKVHALCRVSGLMKARHSGVSFIRS